MSHTEMLARIPRRLHGAPMLDDGGVVRANMPSDRLVALAVRVGILRRAARPDEPRPRRGVRRRGVIADAVVRRAVARGERRARHADWITVRLDCRLDCEPSKKRTRITSGSHTMRDDGFRLGLSDSGFDLDYQPPMPPPPPPASATRIIRARPRTRARARARRARVRRPSKTTRGCPDADPAPSFELALCTAPGGAA